MKMLAPIQSFLKESAWPGMGLFGESFLLFSIGLLKPFWSILYPHCWGGYLFDFYEKEDGDLAVRDDQYYMENFENEQKADDQLWDDDNDDWNRRVRRFLEDAYVGRDDVGYAPCTRQMRTYVTTSAVLGIIVGMIVIGTLSNFIGRRKGSILTSFLMSLSAIALYMSTVVMSARDEGRDVFKVMGLLLFIFGIGVGGEYPLAASSASEKAMAQYHKQLANDERTRYSIEDVDIAVLDSSSNVSETSVSARAKGKKTILVFAMQGAGIFLNATIITGLLYLTGQRNVDIEAGEAYSASSLIFIWEFVYAVAAVILLYVFVSRCMFLEESLVWSNDRNKRNSKSSNTSVNENYVNMDKGTNEKQPFMLGLLIRNYWHKIVGTSLSWLLWDVAFYGNKLFQSAFLINLVGADASLFYICSAATLNAFVALTGYIVAAYLVDKPHVGRVWLQQVGFMLVGVLFIACGLLYEHMNKSLLVMLYLLSSFFGQVGPNATTFLIPAEIFPTEVRTMCHGISASAGKVGALIAAILFHYVNGGQMFFICGYCSLLGALITYITLPETVGLDLNEVDKRWGMIRQGRKDDYDGPAVDPAALSFYEKLKLGLLGE